MDLRQLQAILEISKEESSTIIIYPMSSFGGEMISAATAGANAKVKEKKIQTIDL